MAVNEGSGAVAKHLQRQSSTDFDAGDAKLHTRGGSTTHALPPSWTRHNDLKPGDTVQRTVDFENNCVIIHLEVDNGES